MYLQSIFLLPFWVTVSLLFVGVFYIPFYWEFFVGLIVIELLYRGGTPQYSSVVDFLPFFGIAIFAVIELLRTFIRKQVLRS